MTVFHVLLVLVRSVLRSRAALAAENLALRQQLAVLRRSVRRPKLRARDRLFWVLLSRLWKGWRSRLHMVHPGRELRHPLGQLRGDPKAGGCSTALCRLWTFPSS